MIQDQYKRDAERNQNAVSSALRGAMFVGAIGLVAAHQPWGRTAERFLGRVTETFKRTRADIKNIRQGQGTYAWTKSDYEQFYTSLKNNWAQAAANSDRLRLNDNNKNSLAAFIRATEETVYHANALALRQFSEDVVKKNILQQATVQGLSRDTQNNLNSFIRKAVENAENLALNFELIKQHNLEGQARSLAEQAARDLQDRYRRAKRPSDPMHATVKRMAEAIRREVQKNAYTVETLEKNLGTSRDKTQDIGAAAVELLTRAHRMTWKEANERLAAGTLEDAEITIGTRTVSVAAKMREIEANVRASGGNEAFQRLMQVTVDEANLFVTSGNNAFSKERTGNLWRGFLGVVRNTLPGKLFKIGDLDNALRISPVQFINITAQDPVLRDKLKKIGEDDKVHFRIGKDIFTLSEDGAGELVSSINLELNNGDLRFISGRYGFYHRNIEAMRGLIKSKTSSNWLFRTLDLFQDREEYSGNVVGDAFDAIFGENQRAKRFAAIANMTPEQFSVHRAAMQELAMFRPNLNVTDDFLGISEKTRDYVAEYMNTAKKISAIFRQNTYYPNLGVISALQRNPFLTQESRSIINLLARDDPEEMLKAIMEPTSPLRIKNIINQGSQNFISQDLNNIVSALLTTPEERRNSIELVTNELRLAYSSDLTSLLHSPMGNTTYTFEDTLRRELAKEALLRQGMSVMPSGNLEIKYDRINALLETVPLTTRNRKELNKLAQYAIWQDYTKVNQKTGIDGEMYSDYYQRMLRIDNLFNGTSSTQVSDYSAQKFKDTFTSMLVDEISPFESNLETETAGMSPLEDVVAINRSSSPLDIVKALNHAVITGDKWQLTQGIFSHDLSTIFSAVSSGDFGPLKGELSNIWKGITANREDMSEANLWTYIPYFGMKRLSDELNRIGLGFSVESMGSNYDLAKAFMLKRVLPIAATATYLDWTDDTLREFTGTGLWQGFTAGVANIDLAGRKLISNLGMDDWMKGLKSINPIWQYWGDKDEYQGYDERRRYYQEGYTPVRKAAW